MKEKIEREQDLQLRREELRLIRQQEAEDRTWRKQEMESAQARAIREAEIKMILDEQIRYKHFTALGIQSVSSCRGIIVANSLSQVTIRA